METVKNLDKKKLINLFKQFIRFGIVGFINTVLSYLITNGCYYLLHLHEQIANIIAFIITVFVSSILNRKFVFNQNKEQISYLKSLIRLYAAYSVTDVFITALLLFLEERVLGIPHYIATLMNLAITIPINFFLNKFWTYKEKI